MSRDSETHEDGTKPRSEDGESNGNGAASSHGASGGPIDPDAAIPIDSDRELWIPPDASEAEAAAIAAAVAAYLTDRERAREGESDGWTADRWAFAGRLAALGREPARVPADAPRDPWTASGRTDRF